MGFLQKQYSESLIELMRLINRGCFSVIAMLYYLQWGRYYLQKEMWMLTRITYVSQIFK